MKTALALSLTAAVVIWIHRRRRYRALSEAVGAYYAAEVLA